MAEVTIDTNDLGDLDASNEVIFAQFHHAQLNVKAAKKLKFSAHAEGNSEATRILTCTHRDMCYVGCNTDSSAVRRDLVRIYAGVVDNNNGTMKILPAHLISMSPLIPGDKLGDKLEIINEELEHGIDSEANSAVPTPTKNETAQLQYNLVQSFGSERQKRLLANARRGRVDAKDLGTSMDGIALLEDYQGDKLATGEQDNATSSSVIPAHNIDAKIPSEVYDINDIISAEESASISAASRVFQTARPHQIAQWRDDKTYPDYVLERLPAVNGDHQQLYYLSHLICCYRRKKKNLRDSDLNDMPDAIRKIFLYRFTMPCAGGQLSDRVAHMMPNRLRDKLLCHVVVLSLFVDKFSLDVDALQRNLQIDQSKMHGQLRALGCKVSKKGVDTVAMATLGIPPAFPKKSRKRKRNV